MTFYLSTKQNVHQNDRRKEIDQTEDISLFGIQFIIFYLMISKSRSN